MVRYSTQIDTVGLQVNCNNGKEQRDIIFGILGFIQESKKYYITNNLLFNNNEHRIYTHNTLIATIRSGITRVGSRDNQRIVHYIKIKLSGLKRYIEKIDRLSQECLLRVCAYLNSNQIGYVMNELDICLDVECSFKHLFATCVKRTPNTKYFSPYDTQAYSSTKYLEKVNIKKPNLSTVRSYIYNKSKKENIISQISRFEIKFNTRFFKRNEDALDEAVNKQLNRYYVLYINNMIEKSKVMQLAEKNQNLSQIELSNMGLDKYRVMFNQNYFINFYLKLLDTHIEDFKKVDILPKKNSLF